MNFTFTSVQLSKLNLSTTFLILFIALLVFSSFTALSKAKIEVINGHNAEGFARTQIKNETTKELACWVAIDGFKQKFRLPPASTSRWFTANDKRYSYANFSTWCDNIEFYPEYKNYRNGGKAFG
ncbi:MAG: hypothetical protein P8I03_05885 [Thalassotalea sp.]|nr:hypothetical protein [Thalassotalea sp.]